MIPTRRSLARLIASFLLPAAVATAAPPSSAPSDAERQVTITAGNAYFAQTPQLGTVCAFDFGDPSGAFNTLQGFNAAHIYKTPGTYTLSVRRADQPEIDLRIHVLPDRRSIQKLAAGDRLADAIKTLQNDTIVELPPGAVFDVGAPLDIQARNVLFRPSGPGPMPRIRRVAGGGSTLLRLDGLDISFEHIAFDSDRPMKTYGTGKVRYYGLNDQAARVVINACTFQNLDYGVMCNATTRDVLVQGCLFTDEMRSCDVWVVGTDVVLLGNRCQTSQQEHNVRCSDGHFTNLLLHDNDLTATEGKETLTFRQGQDVYADHNAFHGWVRIGPGPRGDHRYITPEELQKIQARFGVFDHNTFDHGWLQINEGASYVTVTGNRFDVDTSMVPIHVQGPSINHVVIEHNHRVLLAGPTPKPLVRALETGEQDIAEHDNSVKSPEEARTDARRPNAPGPTTRPAL